MQRDHIVAPEPGGQAARAKSAFKEEEEDSHKEMRKLNGSGALGPKLSPLLLFVLELELTLVTVLVPNVALDVTEDMDSDATGAQTRRDKLQEALRGMRLEGRERTGWYSNIWGRDMYGDCLMRRLLAHECTYRDCNGAFGAHTHKYASHK
ncbi:hypothetical protein AcW1_009651 [Taiwanofungus camphoratus]|nr:hypothetical protein AcW1_009651 [Antrodia cinnamomea]